MADEQEQLAVEGGGLVSVVSPSGAAGSVPEESLDEALKMGYRLARPEEHREQRLQQEYGDRPITAAGLGALSSVTFGASDPIMRGLAEASGPDNAISEISNRNQGARVVGELGGLLTPIGAAGALTKVGEKVAGAVGSKALGAVARGATEGSLLGVGQTISQVGLSEDPLTAESVAGDLARNVLFSGLAGGAGSGLGELVGRAAGKASKSFDELADNLATRAAAPGERAALQASREAEVSRLAEAAKPERAALVDELKALRGDQKPLREALSSTIASAPETVRGDLVRSERSLAGIVGNARKLTSQPEAALDAVANYGTHLKDALGVDPPRIAQQMLDRVEALRARLETLAGPPSSAALSDIDTKLTELAKAPAKLSTAGELGRDVVKGVAGAAVFGAAHETADALDLPGAGMLSFLLAGKLAGKIGDALSGKLATRAAEVGARIASAAGAVAGAVERGAPRVIGRAAALAPQAFDAIRQSVLEASSNPQAAQQRINAQLDGIRLRDPALADQLGEIQMRAINHLAQVAPQALGDGPSIAGGKASSDVVSQLEKDRFLRRAEIVLDPTTLLSHLEDGTITPSQVQTGDAVYKELMSTLRTRILQNLKGQEIAPQRALALSILLGAPATAGLRPENIAAAQQRMAAEMAKASSPPRPGSSPKPEEPTAAQRLAGR